jgi:hypothetical protein
MLRLNVLSLWFFVFLSDNSFGYMMGEDDEDGI